MKKDNNSLVVAIVFASLVISGSLVFFATQFEGAGGISESDIEKRVQEGIEEYQYNEAFPLVAVGGADEDDDAVMGDPNAPITIVEFSDYECPYCARFTTQTLPRIIENYIDTGKAKLVYRDFPLSFHPNAIGAAVAAECAREQSDDATYFEFHDKLYEGGALSTERYVQYARELELDLSEFNSCINDESKADEVQADFEDGQKYQITGTPGFVINGRLISGARDYAVFEYLIEKELEN